jgi:hypothetical protein
MKIWTTLASAAALLVAGGLEPTASAVDPPFTSSAPSAVVKPAAVYITSVITPVATNAPPRSPLR